MELQKRESPKALLGDPPVFITEQLALRLPKKTDYLQEKLALQDLARRMRTAPAEFLPLFVDLAMEICGGVAAGLCVYEEHPAPGLFRWLYLRGTLSSLEGCTVPRDFSPCAVTLDSNAPVLATHPERLCDWIADCHTQVPEVLLVPLHLDEEKPLGTLWVVSEDEEHFDSGHARIVTELAAFVGIALAMLRAEERLQHALEEQETVAREMHHRLNNVFALTDGMIRITARTARTPGEMADILSGRLLALARAHQLVQRRVVDIDNNGSEVFDFHSLIRVIVEPHEHTGVPSKFVLEGIPIRCSEQTANSFALIFHELATNAAKYGVLAAPAGIVEIAWRAEGETLVVSWQESGGPEILAAPKSHGFGSILIRKIVRQFGGTLEYDWRREGLKLTITSPLSRFTA